MATNKSTNIRLFQEKKGFGPESWKSINHSSTGKEVTVRKHGENPDLSALGPIFSKLQIDQQVSVFGVNPPPKIVLVRQRQVARMEPLADVSMLNLELSELLKEDTRRKPGALRDHRMTELLTDNERHMMFRLSVGRFTNIVHAIEFRVEFSSFRKLFDKKDAIFVKRFWSDQSARAWLVSRIRLYFAREGQYRPEGRCNPCKFFVSDNRAARELALLGYEAGVVESSLLSLFSGCSGIAVDNLIEMRRLQAMVKPILTQLEGIAASVATVVAFGPKKMTMLISLLLSFTIATTLAQQMLVISQVLIVAGEDLLWCGKELLSSFVKHVASLVPQGKRDFGLHMGLDGHNIFDDTKDLSECIIDSPVPNKFVALLSLWITTGSFRGLPNATQLSIRAAFGACKSVGQETSVVLGVFDLLSTITQSIGNFLKTRNPMCLLGFKEREQLMITAGDLHREFMQQRNNRVVSRPIGELFSAYDRLTPKLARYMSSNPRDESFKALSCQLSDCVGAFRDALSPDRDWPVGIIISGAPGLGKTQFVNALATAHGFTRGVPSDISTVYQLDLSKKYEQRPGLAHVVFVDDIATVKDNISVAQGHGLMDLFVSLVNTTSFRPECAAVEDKNHKLKPDFVIATTNEPSYEFVTAASAPSLSRLVRRYVGMEMVFTAKAVELAKEKNVPLQEIRMVPEMAKVSGLVEYRVGPMWVETKTKSLHFSPRASEVVFRTENMGDVIQYFQAQLLRRQAMTDAMKEVQEDLCPAGFPNGNDHPSKCVCQLDVAVPQGKGGGRALFRAPGSVPGRTLLGAPYSDAYAHYWGAMSVFEKAGALLEQRYASSDTAVYDFCVSEEYSLNEIMATMCSLGCKGCLYCLRRDVAGDSPRWKAWVEKNPTSGYTIRESFEKLLSASLQELARRAAIMSSANPFLGEVHRWVVAEEHLPVVGALAVCTGVGLVAWLLKTAIKSQGHVLSVPSIKEEPAYVQPYRTAHAPSFLGGRRIPQAVGISARLNGTLVSMHALPLSPQLYAFPSHFLTGKYEPDGVGSGSRPAWVPYSGENVTMTLRGGSTIRKFDSSAFSHLGGDLTVVFIREPLSFVNSFFEISDVNSPKGYWQDLPIDIQYSRHLLMHGGTSQEGQCGLPVTDERGDLLGMHTGRKTGTLTDSALARRVRVDEVRGVSNRLVRSIAEGHMMPPVPHEIVGLLSGSMVPGAHPRSTYSRILEWEGPWVEEVTFPLMHSPGMSVPKMTGQRSGLYGLVADVVKEYAQPYAGRARQVEIDGVRCWQGASLKMFRSLSAGEVVNHDSMDKAVRILIKSIPKPSVALAPLTLHQAVCGDCRNQFISPRDDTKSVGPYMKAKGLTKNQVFVPKGASGEYDLHAELTVGVAKLISKLRDGTVETVFQATPKDELLKADAVAEGKVRLFYVGCVILNMVVRMYLLPIAAYMMQFGMATGTASAFNPASGVWGDMAAKLLRGRILAADFKGYDLSHSTMLFRACYATMLIAKHLGYSEEDCVICGRIVFSLIYHLLLIDGELHRVSRGFCSGIPITLYINNVINYLLFYSSVCEQNPMASEEAISENSCLYVQGDDMVGSVTDVLAFDPLLYAKHGSEKGYTITNPENKKAPVSFQRLEDVTFLKRHWVWRLGRWYAPLDPDSIWKSIGYTLGVKKATVAEEECILLSNSREAFLHGEAFYHAFLTRCSGHSVSDRFATFESLTAKCVAGDLIPWEVDAETRLYTGIEPVQLEDVKDKWVALPEGLAERSGGKIPSCRDVVITAAQLRRRSSSHFEKWLWLLAFFLGGLVVSTTSPSFNTFTLLSELISTDPSSVIGGANVAAMKPRPDDSVEGASVGHSFAQPLSATDVDKWASRSYYAGLYPVVHMTGFSGTQPLAAALNVPFDNAGFGYSGYKYSKVRVQLSYVGSANVYGRFFLCAYPKATADVANSIYDASDIMDTDLRCSMWQLPHVELDLSLNCKCELVLPWPFLRDWAEFYENDYIFRIMQMTQSGTVNGTAMDVMHARLYITFEGFEYMGMKPQGAVEQPHVALDRALAYARRVAQGFSWFISPVMAVARLGVAAGEVLGFSRPLIGITGRVIASGPDIANASGGPGVAIGLGLDPACGRSVHGLMPGESETSVVHVVGRSGCLSQLAAGTPMVCRPGAFALDPSGFFHQSTPQSFVASCFRYWRGDFDVTLHFGLSPLLRGSVIVSVFPSRVTPFTVGTGRFYEFEVTGSTDVKVRVPYEHKETMLSTLSTSGHMFQWDWAIQPRTTDGVLIDITPLVTWSMSNASFEVPDLQLPVIGGDEILASYQGAMTGEDTSNLMTLTRRSCYNATLEGGQQAIALPLDGFVSNYTSGTLLVNKVMPTFYNHISQAYAYKSGGTVLTFVSDAPTRLTATEIEGVVPGDMDVLNYVSFSPGLVYAPVDSSTGTALSSSDNVMAVSVPDRFPVMYRFAAVNGIPTVRVINSALRILRTEITDLTMYIAGAEDMALSMYLVSPVYSLDP